MTIAYPFPVTRHRCAASTYPVAENVLSAFICVLAIVGTLAGLPAGRALIHWPHRDNGITVKVR
ncbi:hypothetical protein MHPYR_610021 [uncultured Mycobacterium sp.]|uniref:Uncharacterized protein n=1 Tax=uncultured Mycobacterium sp. TaxID=171292 RepID=A0A1Y5PRI1_9MYCO|nr:hypothetical protein MHPYR_610021 [uncultured Mycobacterium sp.]